MQREESPFEYRGYWLSKRRDGRSASIWQITWKHGSTVALKSTGCRTDQLEAAKSKLLAHAIGQTSRIAGQAASDTHVLNLFKNYWLEHGQDAIAPRQIESSLRVFMGFLVQEPDLGALATVDKLTPDVFDRFRAWRMKPHRWEVVWFGKTYIHNAKPVKGETVSRNFDDVSAALRHNHRRGRVAMHVFVPPVPKHMRSPARECVLSIEELGKIVGYARQDCPAFYAWIVLMLATAARPMAALQFEPSLQVIGNTIDLHPPAWERSKKVNPIVPAIPEILPLFDTWQGAKANSRKTAWRTMRRALELSDDVFPKTIRHTVATMLLDEAMSAGSELTPMHIEALLGHRVTNRVTAIYAKFNVRHLTPLVEPLSHIWTSAHDAANDWSSGHSLDTGSRGTRKNIAITM